MHSARLIIRAACGISSGSDGRSARRGKVTGYIVMADIVMAYMVTAGATGAGAGVGVGCGCRGRPQAAGRRRRVGTGAGGRCRGSRSVQSHF